MKYIYLSLLFSISTLSSFSQNYFYNPSDVMEDTLEINGYTAMYMHIMPADSQEITLKWTLISNTFDTGWSYSLCDYPNCYPGIPDSGYMDSISTTQIQSGFSPFFQLIVATNDVESEGTVRLRIENAKITGRVDTVTFHIVNILPTDTGSPALINEVGMSEFRFFPNPSTHQITMTASEEAHLCVYNVLNEQVMTFKLHRGQTSMDISALPVGRYYLQYTSKNHHEIHALIKR